MATLTTTLNFSGQLYVRGNDDTRFLDAVYMRGKNGGRRQTDSVEFVLMSGYEAEEPEQPEISEVQSMTAPTPETVERDQEYNVTQIFHRSVEVSYLKQSNRGILIPGYNQTASKTEGGVALNQIMTHFGNLSVDYDRRIPKNMLVFVNMGEMAVVELPYIDENGVNHGVLFYEQLSKIGAVEKGQLFAAGLGCDYGWEGMHIVVENLG